MASRILRDSIKTSPTLDALSEGAEVTFYRLLTCADDHGRFETDPRVALAGCYPMKVDRLRPSAIERWLNELVEADAIRLYTVGGRRFGYFPTWLKHQRAPRYTKSKFPAPEEADTQVQAQPGEVRTVPDSSRRRRANPPVVSSTQLRETRYGGSGKRVQGETHRPKSSFQSPSPQTNGALPNYPSRGNGKSKTLTAEQRLLVEWRVEVIRGAPAPQRRTLVDQAAKTLAKELEIDISAASEIMAEVDAAIDKRSGVTA